MFKKHLFTYALLSFLSWTIFAQSTNDFVLQGIVYGEKYEQVQGTVYIQKKGDNVIVRQEFLNDEKDYLLANVRFSEASQEFVFTETTLISKRIGLQNQLCLSVITLKKEDTLGYWRGTIKSTQCRNKNFNVICYISSLEFNDGNTNIYANFWVKEFQKRLLKKWPSPKKMEEKRANFKLFTIYFDYDKSDIRQEYMKKLEEMTMIVDSHSDYRIRITGHTDSDGSDGYNDELSKNRAAAIKNYFLSKGIPDHKLVIDFKGKRLPIDNNATPEGKQRNRRVEIGFI